MKLKKFSVSLMSLVLAVTVGTTGVYAGKSASQLTQDSKDIKSKISDTQSKLDDTKQEQSSVAAEVKKLDNELTQAQNELDTINNNLESTNKRLKKSEEDWAKAVIERDNQYDTLKKRIRVMYENGSTGYLNVLMEADGFSDFLVRIEYVNKLMNYDNNLLAQYQKNEETIANTVEEIKVDKANLETLQAEQEEKTKELDAKVAEKEALMNKLNADASSYEQQIKELEAEDAEVQKLIEKANAEAAAKAKAAAAAKAKTSSSSSSSSKSKSSSTTSSSSGKIYASTGGRKFMYPVPAYSGYKPNDIYGGRYSPITGKYESHSGLDLKATLNTDIVAAASGTVIFSGWKNGYGNCVIIDHGDGYSTLYGHNNSLVARVGQSVSQGQVIAKAGSTGYSTGVHCHFEVRINGATTNPYPYLFG